jgi:heme-degrading monooxygenase HmoA
MVFSVLFQVHPSAAKYDNYLQTAIALRPEVEKISGFLSNSRYRSLSQPGWVFSHNTWQDEKALIRWRTTAKHHFAQERGRQALLEDYHLRVAKIVFDNTDLDSTELQRLDVTEVGVGKTIVLVDQPRDTAWIQSMTDAHDFKSIANALAFDGAPDIGISHPDLADWDVFEGLRPEDPESTDVILLSAWKTTAIADEFVKKVAQMGDRRVRILQVIRDYGMFDRREAPQYYPDAERDGRDTIH